MLDSILNRLPKGRDRGLVLAVGGMGALLAGGKTLGITLFAGGFADLESAWREAHPEFTGDLKARWAEAVSFYEATHRDPTNRILHVVGIPLILGGVLGLLVAPSYSPPWWVAAGAFGTGWALNIVGHSVFEKNRPAFADDPLSFLAGPVWDLRQVRTLVEGRKKPSMAA
jgi:hypothetical protein